MSLRSLWLLPLVAVGSFVHAADAPTSVWKEGTNYFLIEPPLPSDTASKIEVTEVFSYGCPACNFAYPTIDKLKKALPATAVLNYVPASFKTDESWPMFQRAYYTAEALGIADKSHDAMFDAVWKSQELPIMNADGRTLKQPQPTIEDAAKVYAKFGVKAEDFVATAKSFSINAKMKRADAFLKSAGIDSTPTIVVAGKYRFTFMSAGDADKALQLALYLVQLESSAK